MNSQLAASLFVIAVGIAANPPGIIVQIGLLGSKGGHVKGAVYLTGLFTSLAAFGIAAYVIFGRLGLSSNQGAASTTRWGIHLLGGLIVVGAGLWLWRQPAEAVGGFIGKALEDLDKVKLGLTFLLGFLLVNYALELAGALTVLQANLTATVAISYYVAFAVVAASTIWLPLVLAYIMPLRWKRWSMGIRDFMVKDGNVVLGVMIVFIGVLISAQAVLGYLGK